jgi:diguanylate cyclase (GGDEF)-like protein
MALKRPGTTAERTREAGDWKGTAVPLRVRLSITLVAIVLIPLSVTAVLVMVMINGQQRHRIADQLDYGTASLVGVLQATSDRADDTAGDLITAGAGSALSSGHPAPVRARVAQFAKGTGADFVAIANGRGKVVAVAIKRAPHYGLANNAPPAADQIAAMATDVNRHATSWSVYSAVAITVHDCATCVIGHAIAGFWLDDLTLREVAPAHADVTLVDRDKGPVTTTLNDPKLIALVAHAKRGEPVTAGPLLVSGNQVLSGGPIAYTSVSRLAIEQNRTRTWRGLVAVLAVFFVMSAMLGWLMARITTRPLAELSDAALAVAAGALDTHIEVRSRDEVGRLAYAFNTMTDELRSHIDALRGSRDELKQNLTRLGDTLSSTHDLKKMLAVILETAMVTMRAEAGALMLFSPNRDELFLRVGRGLDGRLATGTVRVEMGDGVAGRVAQTGEGVHGQVGPGANGDLRLAPGEPRADCVIAVPLKSQGRVIGVLNLYDRIDADAFDEEDLATVRSFANQASVAIDNVLLHQEAQRLSITDGLTGLWNYRYFQMNFDKEIERASRFQRPLSLLIFDLDKFKSVNDEYGHQRGDSVLIELATRVKGAIREVDILARYGGEEFVLILPETDLDGATLAAGKINELVRQRRFGAAGEQPIRVTVSIGIAVYPEHGRSGATLIKSADAALYAAKEAGRDGYWVATPMPAMPSVDDLRLERRQEPPPIIDSVLAGTDTDNAAAPIDAAAAVPADVAAEVPADIPAEAPVVVATDIPAEAPADVATDIPDDIPAEAPADVATDVLVEFANGEPAEVATEAPAPDDSAGDAAASPTGESSRTGS